jgi:hypothetical protein
VKNEYTYGDPVTAMTSAASTSLSPLR